MSATLTKNCPMCGAEFKTYRSINKKNCSSECAQLAAKAETYRKYKQNCEVCGVEFLPPRPKDGGRFCSYKCRGLADRKERVDRNGYWYVFCDEHPRKTKQGYVAEHTLVMEAHIGRYLRDNEVVHHKDHDRKNNEISNLELMLDSEHRALHLREAIAEEKIGGAEQRERASQRMKENNPALLFRGPGGRYVSASKARKEGKV